MESGKSEEKTDEKPQKTLFIRNLPYSTNNKKLEETFADFGPIKQAFVVKDKDNHARCRGFGYVQFVLQEDADKAMQADPISLQGRNLNITYSRKKPKHEKRKRLQSEADGVSIEEDEKEIKNEEVLEEPKVKKKKEERTKPPKKDAKPSFVGVSDEVPKIKHESEEVTTNEKKDANENKSDVQRTIVVTGLTEKVKRKAIRLLCETFGTVENIVYPVPERTEVTAFIRYQSYKSTIRAVQKVSGRKVKKSNVLTAVLLSKEGKHPSKKSLQKCRLIVRNLSFKCSEEQLKKLFEKYGRVHEVQIPIKTAGKKEVKLGYAFVQFVLPANAKEALEKINMTEILGRTVVVDWAVPKDEYKPDQTKDDSSSSVKETDVTEDANKKKKEDTQKKKKKKKSLKTTEEAVEKEEDSDANEDDEDSEAESEEEEQGSEVENDEEDVEDDEEEEEEEEEGEEVKESEEEADDVDEDDDGSDEDMDEEDDEEEKESDDDAKKERLKVMKRDAKEGKTIFLRNLSYNADDEDIVEEFEKYGDIEFCKIVCDPETGHSKGTAFLKFKEKTSADACIAELEELSKKGKPLHIDGRAITVTLAVTRGKVDQMISEKNDSKKEEDKRNLYLAYEGVITKNSPAAQGLSDAELAKREKALAEKKAKLKNTNFFVSRTRLCMRNLPLTIDNDELRTVLNKHCEAELKINSIKIMRNKERLDTSGKPRSLGFCFVDFSDHEDAMQALRATNNNPDVFGPSRRPIVEFAVENMKAVKIQEFRKQKIEEMNRKAQEKEGAGMESVDQIKKKKRFEKMKKRKEKFQKRRLEKQQQRDKDSGKNEKVDNDKQENNNTSKKNKKKQAKSVPNANEKEGQTDSRLKNSKGNKRTSSESAHVNDSSNVDDGPKPKISRKQSLAEGGRQAKRQIGKKDEQKFNKLVSSYKKKLLGADNAPKKTEGARWFE